MRKFEKLHIWQKVMDLAVDVYKATENFRTEEKYGLISQMRRCSVSILSNIAEGSDRNSNPRFNQFLSIANGRTSG